MMFEHVRGNENNPFGNTILTLGTTLLIEKGEVTNKKTVLLCELELPPFNIIANREQLTSAILTFTY